MQPLQQPAKSLSEIVNEYKEFVASGELQDILESLKALKLGSGWGRVELKYLNRDLDNIEIGITKKPKKKT